MRVKIKYDRCAHQQDFHSDLESKYLHMSGGFGCGKSHALVMKALQLSYVNKHRSGGFLCPSFSDYKKDIEPLFEQILHENNIKFRYHKNDKWFRFPWQMKSRAKLYIFTAEKAIRGPNLGYGCINEVTLMKEEAYKDFIGRVRVPKVTCPQIASVGTPEGIGHWLYERMIENPKPRSRVVYGETRNNPYVHEDYIRSLEESYDSIWLDAYLKGLWVNMSSNRFYYAYDPAKSDDEQIKYVDGALVHCSMDFNVDPMSAVLWHYDGVRLSAFDEITIPGEKRGADTNMMCDALIARGYHPNNTVIYPDPAGRARSTKGQPDIEILRQRGFYQIKVRNKAPGFRQRQLNVNNLLDKGVIRINPNKCVELKKDLVSVEQDVASQGKVKKDARRTHHSDGMDYLCDNLFPYSGRHNQIGSMRIR